MEKYDILKIGSSYIYDDKKKLEALYDKEYMELADKGDLAALVNWQRSVEFCKDDEGFNEFCNEQDEREPEWREGAYLKALPMRLQEFELYIASRGGTLYDGVEAYSGDPDPAEFACLFEERKMFLKIGSSYIYDDAEKLEALAGRGDIFKVLPRRLQEGETLFDGVEVYKAYTTTVKA